MKRLLVLALWILTAVGWLSLPTTVVGQTCSCAGAPLVSGQSISSASQGNLLVGITHQYHDISKVLDGSRQLENVNTRRWTQSSLLEINYGLTERLTAMGTISYVQKYRQTGLQQEGIGQTLITRGVGDGIILLKYVLHRNTIQEQYQLAIGGGAKIPYGVHSLRSENLMLNADMQPGSGAWDGILWTYFSKTFAPVSTVNLFWFNTFRRTGVNERFGANDRYRFGNQLESTLGIQNAVGSRWAYQLMVRYLYRTKDRRNGNEMPNTGGDWVYLKPGLTFSVSDRISLQLSGQVPVYQHLQGLQPTTSFKLTGSLFYNFGNRIIF